jgi:hypothetical protein
MSIKNIFKYEDVKSKKIPKKIYQYNPITNKFYEHNIYILKNGKIKKYNGGVIA